MSKAIKLKLPGQASGIAGLTEKDLPITQPEFTSMQDKAKKMVEGIPDAMLDKAGITKSDLMKAAATLPGGPLPTTAKGWDNASHDQIIAGTVQELVEWCEEHDYPPTKENLIKCIEDDNIGLLTLAGATKQELIEYIINAPEGKLFGNAEEKTTLPDTPDPTQDVEVPLQSPVPPAPKVKASALPSEQKSPPVTGGIAKIKLEPVVSTSVAEKAQLDTEPYVDLPIVKNPESNSEFFVVGVTDEGLRLSMRFWMDPADPGFTRIGLRTRLGDILPDYPALEVEGSMYQYIENAYPAVAPAVASSSKVSKLHVSIESAILIPDNPWEKAAALSHLKSSGFAEALWDKFMDVFIGIQMIPKETFVTFVHQQVYRCIADVPTPSWVHASKQVLWRIGLTKEPLMFKEAAKDATGGDPGEAVIKEKK